MTTIIQYPLDPTGINIDNLVSNELHTLIIRPLRYLVPNYSAFYADSMVIKDVDTNAILNSNQWYPTELQEEPTSLYGKGVYKALIINDASIGINVLLTYQSVGGKYSDSDLPLEEFAATTDLYGKPINFSDIAGIPKTFLPLSHLHDSKNIYGFEFIVKVLQGVVAKIGNNKNALNVLYGHMLSQLTEVRTMDQLQLLVNKMLFSIGLDPNGNYVAPVNSAYLAASTSLVSADLILDNALSTVNSNINKLINSLNNEVEIINSQLNTIVATGTGNGNSGALSLALQLSGFNSAVGTISSNDTLLTALEKLNGNLTNVSANVAALSNTLSASQGITFNNQTVTAYTTVLTDANFAGQNGNFLTFNNAAPQTVTIPEYGTVPYPIGAVINVSQLGTGKVTFVGSNGVTIESAGGLKSIASQFIAISLLQTSIDNWLLVGNLIQ